MSIYNRIYFGLIFNKDLLSDRLNQKAALKDGLHVNSDPDGCKLRRVRGYRQGSHRPPYHAPFCSIIASCSQW